MELSQQHATPAVGLRWLDGGQWAHPCWTAKLQCLMCKAGFHGGKYIEGHLSDRPGQAFIRRKCRSLGREKGFSRHGVLL